MNIKNKTVAVYPYLDIQRDIEILNKLTEYIRKAQKEAFQNYVSIHRIEFADHRSLDAIRKFEMEYIDGIFESAGFRVTINYPEVDSKYKSESIFNPYDYLFTNNYSFRISIGKSDEYNIGEDYAGEPRISMETLHSKIHPVFFTKVFDQFREPYFINGNIARNVFKRQIPFMR